MNGGPLHGMLLPVPLESTGKPPLHRAFNHDAGADASSPVKYDLYHATNMLEYAGQWYVTYSFEGAFVTKDEPVEGSDQ